MPETFSYKVRDKSGKLVEGQLEAENAQLVVSKLRSMGFVPIEIEQQAGPGLGRDLKIPFFSDRIKLKDVSVFSRQFATMINSGLSMLRSLYILAEQTESKTLAEVVNQVRLDVDLFEITTSDDVTDPNSRPPSPARASIRTVGAS